MKRIKVLSIVASLRIGGAEKVAADIGLRADPQKYIVHYVVFGDEIGHMSWSWKHAAAKYSICLRRPIATMLT